MNLKQKEAILIGTTASSWASVIGRGRLNRHYDGSTNGDSIYGMREESKYAITVDIETKLKLLGGFRLQDAARTRKPEDNVESERQSREPMSWYVMHSTVTEELLHRFVAHETLHPKPYTHEVG